VFHAQRSLLLSHLRDLGGWRGSLPMGYSLFEPRVSSSGTAAGGDSVPRDADVRDGVPGVYIG